MTTPTFSASIIRRLLAALPTLAALSACETVVDLPEPPHTPRIALQYTLSNTPYVAPPTNQFVSYLGVLEARQPFVSNSQRIFDTKRLEGRDDATVEVRDEQGAVVERFKPMDPNQQFYGPGSYEPTLGLVGTPGRTYTLRATLPGFEAAESTVTLPEAPVIVSATYTPLTGSNPVSSSYSGRLIVTVADNPATKDYYLAFARILDRQGQPAPSFSPVQTDFNSQDSDFNVDQFQLSGSYNILPFADTNVNGRQFALNSIVYTNNQFFCSDPRNCPQDPPGYLEVFVSKLSADTYNFYQSRRRYQDAEGNPFAEPAPLASNIRAGYGLFGGATDATYRIKLF